MNTIKILISILFGVFIGWFLFSSSDQCSEMRGSDETNIDSDIFGVNFEYGENAKKSVKVLGLPVTEESRDWYYCIAGLKGVTEFVGFSLPQEKIWPTVEMITKKKKQDFSQLDFFKGPESFGEEYKTLLFNVEKQNLISSNFEFKGSWAICAVNEDESRILFNIISDD